MPSSQTPVSDPASAFENKDFTTDTEIEIDPELIEAVGADVRYFEFVNDPAYTRVFALKTGMSATIREPVEVPKDVDLSITLIPRAIVSQEEKNPITDPERLRELEFVLEIPCVKKFMKDLAIYSADQGSAFGSKRFNGNDFRGSMELFEDPESVLPIRLLEAVLLRNDSRRDNAYPEELIFVGQVRTREPKSV